MSDYSYDRLPTSDEKRRFPQHAPTSDVHELHRRLAQDPRFNPPTPSPWKRVALLAFVLAILWLAFSLRMSAKQSHPQVIHAQRYVCLP